MIKLKKIFSIGLAFAMVFSMSVSAFASDYAQNEVSTRSDGYTYWKIKKEKTGDTVNGSERVVVSGQGGRAYSESVKVTITETISATINIGLKESIEAALGVMLSGSSERTRTVSGVFGGPNYNPNKRYEVRSWAVYDLYSVKGKEYQRIDGYEVATGNSFGYSGDKKGSYTVKKFRTIAYGDTFLVK